MLRRRAGHNQRQGHASKQKRGPQQGADQQGDMTSVVLGLL
jgi:hypothetical protein